MMYFKRSIIVCLSVILIFVILVISCDVNEPIEEEDPYALWKEQPNERIVFMSKADSPEGDLYLLDKNGDITRLTNNNRHENNPDISFDGKKVAFNGGDESNQLNWEIYILDLNSGFETQITDNNVIDAHPDWSPDGAKIVFKSTRNTEQSGREEIYIMNSDGSDPQRLTTTTGWQSDHDPSWRPNSGQILFTRFEGSRIWYDVANFAEDWEELTPWNVHRVDLNGNVERLTNSSDAGWGVTLYSADASQILFGMIDWITNNSNRVIGGNHRLILMDIDGSNQRQLLTDDEHTGTLEYFDW